MTEPKPQFVFSATPPAYDGLRRRVNAAYRADEAAVLDDLLPMASFDDKTRRSIERRARELVAHVRARRRQTGGIDAFMTEYDLSSQEGIVLMCMAEALLRIPDADTADKLIRDKISDAQWDKHLGGSDSLFVNASTWGLMLTGRVVSLDRTWQDEFGRIAGKLISRAGEPIIRQAMTHAMRIMGKQFVMGRTIDEALARARESESKGYRHSYDMLGEAARTMADADGYMADYAAAIDKVGEAAPDVDVSAKPSISIKLSALHPRYEVAQAERVMTELAPRLLELARQARDRDIAVTVDAEEADRLDISLDIVAWVVGDASLKGWDGLGLAIQAYQKRTSPLIDWLADLARKTNRRIPLRLVKGAYWDTEVKHTQEQGLTGYPVFTRKPSTDVSYIACAMKLLSMPEVFYPQFATHNAQTLATILTVAKGRKDFEFQRLHGMGEALYEQIVGDAELGLSCRVYAPVGSHEHLLAYLVRRLLENGANTSFVNRIVDDDLPLEAMIGDPAEQMRATEPKPHPKIALPKNLYGDSRQNSAGLDLSDREVLTKLAGDMARAAAAPFRAAPLVGGEAVDGKARVITDPADRRRDVGTVVDATQSVVEAALAKAHAAAASWSATPVDERARCLERTADLLEQHIAEAMAIAAREAGKTLVDGVAEVREAVDFCRYYAMRARLDFDGPTQLPGPTGERNVIELHGRGVFLCISPWNFPLAIFTGQVSAALAAGNAVLAKPAEQTSAMATFAVRLMHQAGIPGDVLHLLPGDGVAIGGQLIADERIAGVAFTGSTDVAHLINRGLAARNGAIVPLIAETGGQNAMIVDSTALPEQVAADVIRSAVNSAGQRCSALRMLFVQEDVGDRMIGMLVGAMAELNVGDPGLIETDVGPVIDDDAKAMLDAHADRMDREAKLLFRADLPAACANGTFFAPRAYEIASLDLLEREVFGPVLHVARFDGRHLDKVVDAINRTGYGLTLGVHTRIDETARFVAERARVGNVYINRNMIGAIVGSQPFGGEGLSGTGPKAGGPRYLHRFATERVISTDTTAAGGNAALMTLEEG